MDYVSSANSLLLTCSIARLTLNFVRHPPRRSKTVNRAGEPASRKAAFTLYLLVNHRDDPAKAAKHGGSRDQRKAAARQRL